MVIAESFSQTYLRNAFNNGFPCIECPGLARHLRATVGAPSGARSGAPPADPSGASEPTIIPGGEIAVDFVRGTVRWGEAAFRFPALGTVAQDLVIAGGIENQLRGVLAAGGAAGSTEGA
jgi:homoaconitate hydratase